MFLSESSSILALLYQVSFGFTIEFGLSGISSFDGLLLQ